MAPRGSETRPTSDAVREAIFGAVISRRELANARVLDLFAGSGALGIEALSRGAAEVTFVDKAVAAVSAVEANLVMTGLSGGHVVRGSVLAWLNAHPVGDGWTLVFADPPYAFDEWERLFSYLQPHVPGDGLMVAESDREVPTSSGWLVVRSKRYGGTVITMASRVPAQE